jgi:3-deoxy-D-manno-octulosonic-acid transferase
MKFIIWFLVWFIYFPILKILVLFLSWHPKVFERKKFEKKNNFESLSQSFSLSGQSADLCFEFSSEGEFQQVASLIEDALGNNKKVEIVFFSPSVEKTVLKLASCYPNQIRYLRYPLLRLFPFVKSSSFLDWVTSPHLILVRYDLFPDFLLWSFKKSNVLKMIWVTFKKERSLGRSPSFWKLLFMKNAQDLIFAGSDDQIQAKELGFRGEFFDFRAVQIQRRLEKREEKFQDFFPLYPQLKKLILGSKKNLIFGNAWPSDLFLLEKLPEDYLLVLVPHKLNSEIIGSFKKVLASHGRVALEVDGDTQVIPDCSTIILNRKGLLCELYADFCFAYVGGGFEKSIHSVLEPLVAGTSRISSGPCHFRSTEFDLAFQMNRITEVNTPSEFIEWLKKTVIQSDHDRIKLLLKNYNDMRELVISC